MTYIKKIVMDGFKSFPSKTEVLLNKGINVVIGPNGSGKSNISDALCFALGRLSIKSIRAAKAKNLIFMGSKVAKPAKEASVELTFDNTDRTFNIPLDEITIQRIVKDSGQSIYKLNGEVKTRNDVVEVLANCGIDPYGFNIVLQGQIQAFVKMHPEERRKIMEEVAGISIYEVRKEKSLKELDKTELRLKEISTVLRERSSFLKNLENERAQALKYKDLEMTIKRSRASILNRRIEDKQKEIGSILKSVEEKLAQKEKLKARSDEFQKEIDGLNERIAQINKYVQKSTGLEQDSLHENIANLKAELEGLRVRKENYENRKQEIDNRIEQMKSSIPEYETEILELRKKSPLVAKKQEELKKKKDELAKIEDERKNAYKLKTELNGLKDRVKDKESHLVKTMAESESLLKQMESYSSGLKYRDLGACKKALSTLKLEIDKNKEALGELNKLELENTKLISVGEAEIRSADKIKGQIKDIDTCPLCQSKMTESHVGHVNRESEKRIDEAKEIISKAQGELKELISKRAEIHKEIQEGEKNLSAGERELSIFGLIKDKNDSLKRVLELEKILKQEMQALLGKRDELERKSYDVGRLEEQYSSKIMEIEEISSRTEKDLDNTLLFKERELERIRDVVKHSKKSLEEVDIEISDLTESLEKKSGLLEDKEKEEAALNEKYKQMFKERDELQEKVQSGNYNFSTMQNEVRAVEDQVNYLKIGSAKANAEKDALEMEIKDYSGVELIKATIPVLQEKLEKAQQIIQTIGPTNMRALEIYDGIKEEYDKIAEKVTVLATEKEQILKIIDEIDNKKKKTFMKTFTGINDLFTRNFSQLSSKGQAFLEIENQENIFEGGIDIGIKMGKGKYFDVSSMSGGEQTLIALSLIFAIQEHKPHYFYVFDEIDAALDKRNSERLSGLLKQYIQSGQYVIVTHNDAIITDSDFLYGVSMQDGVSKILSLKLKDSETPKAS